MDVGHEKDTFQLIHQSEKFSFSFPLSFVWQNMSRFAEVNVHNSFYKESVTSVIYIKTFRYFFPRLVIKSLVILIILTILILFLTILIFLLQS